MSRTTLVILTHNRRREACDCVARALTLPEKPPVIVVDNASTDGTARALRSEFPGLLVIEAPSNLGAAGRNLGVARASTPFVAFCDDDTEWIPGAIRLAETLFDDHPGVALMCAHVVVGDDDRDHPVSLAMARSPLRRPGLPGPAILGFLAGASIVRRGAFLDVGGFEPRFFVGGEEELLAFDLMARGWYLAYVYRLLVRHRPSTVRDAAQRRFVQDRNALWVAWLRRPVAIAWRRTIATLRQPGGGDALRAAIRELRWVVRERRLLPPLVESWQRRLESGG